MVAPTSCEGHTKGRNHRSLQTICSRGTLSWPVWGQRATFNSHWFACERGAVVRRTRPGCGEHPGKWSRPELSECYKSHRVCVPDRLLRGVDLCPASLKSVPNGTLSWPGWGQRATFNSHWFACERGAVVRRTRPGCGEHPGKWSRPEPIECNESHGRTVPDRLLRGSTSVRLRSKACRWHPFVARVGPALRVQFPPREPSECNERWWRRWELNPLHPKTQKVPFKAACQGSPSVSTIHFRVYLRW
jgi:hypothetical protein